MDLLTFAAHVGISGKKHIGKIKERLSRSIKELEQLGDFIEREDDRYAKQGVGRWTIRFAAVDTAPSTTSRQQTKSNLSTPIDHDAATKLVAEFYRRWNGNTEHRVSKHERVQAGEVINRYGEDAAREMLPLVIRQMKKLFPNARLFGAAATYWRDAEQILQRRNRPQSFNAQTSNEQSSEDADREKDRLRWQRLRQKWQELDDGERASILDHIAKTADNTVRKFIAEGKQETLLVELACLNELQRRRPL